MRNIGRVVKTLVKLGSVFLAWTIFVTFATPVLSAPLDLVSVSNTSGIVACMNFSDLAPGQSVEGLGTVHPLLNISSTGNSVVVAEGDAAAIAYGAPNPSAGVGQSILNNKIGVNGGFTDIDKLHQYEFSFADGVTINYFSVRLYDFGDFNSVLATEHKAELLGFDASGSVLATHALEYTSDASVNPTTGSAGNLQLTGDAATALPQEPGNFTFTLNGSGISRVALEFSHNKSANPQASDPNIGLAVLCFQTEGSVNTNLCIDFTAVAPGNSVEGLGTLHPELNISTSGNAVAIQQGNPVAVGYGAPNLSAGLGGSIVNNAVGELGGFTDISKVHDYEFTFASGFSVDFFAVKMLDYGDFNAALATDHSISLLAYNDADELVSFSELTFTSDAGVNPTTGSAGNLQLSGDAVTALPQEPGNFTFSVSGTGITRLTMQYANNVNETGLSDPNFGLALLCFVPETVDVPDIPTDATCVDFTALTAGASVEGIGTLHQDLNISSTGNAVAIYENDATAVAYGAPNPSAGVGTSILNNGVGPLGGFVDLDKLHDYGFSFAEGSSASLFAVKMLDYGDYNAARATEHRVSLVAYDNSNNVVATSLLEFTSDDSVNPTTGSAGNLQFSGDAVTALPQEPGNFVFAVQGAGITRLSLEFTNNTGEGHQVSDPNFGLSVLCFELEDDTPPPPTDLPLSCEDIGYQTVAEEPWLLHVINRMRPTTLDFARPAGADYAIINTGWEWTGHPNQLQVTEMHTVETPIGSTTSEDYGNEELAGQVLWYDVLRAAYTQSVLPVTIDYAGDGSDPGSHYSHGLVAWCATPGGPPPPPQLDPPTAALTLLSLQTSPEVSGKFRVNYACSQTAPNLVSATLNNYDVADGQELNLVIRNNQSARIIGGVLLWLYAPEFNLKVTCADDSGNQVSTTIQPEFVLP